MKRYAVSIFFLLVVLPNCGGNKKEKIKHIGVNSLIEPYNIESVYKEQSLREAALSSIRRSLDSTNNDNEENEQYVVKKIEARYLDIPIPLNALPLAQYFIQADNGDVCLAYKVSMILDEVHAFYQREMERFGWQREALSEGCEVLLIYKKPSKIAVISLRTSTKKSHSIKIIISQMYIE